MLVLALLMINPPANNENSLPPGNIIVHITWPPGDNDVDLWVHGPTEPWAVGFSNKGGILWNLLRDDLGTIPDFTEINYENSYTRGIVPGEYTVNVDCFRCYFLPVIIKVEITMNVNTKSGGSIIVPIANSTVTLSKNKQETTALRFKIGEDLKVIKDSFSTVYRPLKTWKKGKPPR